MISVGWAVTTSSMPRLQTARCRASGDTPPESRRRQRFFDRRRLRTRARVTLVGAAPAHAMMLLGDVGQVQEMREAARDRQRRLDRHGAQLAGERFEAVRRRHPRPLGERAHALDALEERLPFLAAQRLAEQFAEQAHVVAQRPVRVDRVLSRARYHESPDATLEPHL